MLALIVRGIAIAAGGHDTGGRNDENSDLLVKMSLKSRKLLFSHIPMLSYENRVQFFEKTTLLVV